MAGGAAKYARNIGKSLVYSAIDVTKQYNPAITAFSQNNATALKETYTAIRHLKTTVSTISTNVLESKYGQVGKDALRNIKDDLKTGKFYNLERKEKSLESAAMGMSADDMFDEFGDFDMSTEFDSSDDEDDIGSVVDMVGKKSSEAVSDAIIRTAEYTADVNTSLARASAEQNKAIYANLHSGMNTINENLSKMLEFMTEPMTAHLENSKQFYESETKLSQERNEILKELLTIQKNIYSSSQQYNMSDRVTMGMILDENGIPDLSTYVDRIKQNIKDNNSDTMSFINEMIESGVVQTMIASPLEGITKGLVQVVVPKMIKQSMLDINKTLSGVFTSGMAKLNQADGGPVLDFIKNMFGIDDSVKTGINTSKYKKDAVPFDGITRKSIVEVIPTYLARIESAVTRGPERRYNYETGKFVGLDEIKKTFGSMEKRAKDIANFDIQEYLDAFMNQITFQGTDKQKKARKDSLKQDLDRVLDESFKRGLLMNPQKRESASSYGLKGKESENNFKMIQAMIAGLPKQVVMNYARNVYDSKEMLTNDMKRLEANADDIAFALFNGSLNGVLPFQMNKLQNDKNIRKALKDASKDYRSISSGSSNNKDDEDEEEGSRSILDKKLKERQKKRNERRGIKTKKNKKKSTASKTDSEAAAVPDDSSYEYDINWGGGYAPFDSNVYKSITETIPKHLSDIVSLLRSGKGLSTESTEQISDNIPDEDKNIPDTRTTTGSVKYYRKRNAKAKHYRKKNQNWSENIKHENKNSSLGFGQVLFDDDDIDRISQQMGFTYQALGQSLYESNSNSEQYSEIRENIKDKLMEHGIITEKTTKFLERVNTLIHKPTDFIAGVIKKADTAIYELLFGVEYDEQGNKKSVSSVIFDGLKSTFSDFKKWMKGSIFKPIIEWFDEEGTLGNKAKKKVKSMFGKAKDSEFVDRMKNEAKVIGKSVKNAASDVADTIVGATTDDDTSLRDTINSTISGLSNSIDNAAKGIKRVNKTGVVAVSEGEMIVPPDLNPYNIKKRKKNEDKAKNEFISSLLKSGVNGDDIPYIPGFAEGTKKVEPTKFRIGLAKEWIMKMKNDPEGAKREFNRLSKKERAIVIDALRHARNTKTGKNVANTIKGMGEVIDSGVNSFEAAFKRGWTTDEDGEPVDGKELKEDQESLIKNAFSELKKYAPEVSVGGILGGGVSLLTGAIGGPLVGAAVGAGISLIRHSDKVQQALFGEKDEEGKFQGNLFNKNISQAIQKYVPSMGKGGALGGIVGLMPFLPGGPVSGIILGSAIGFASQNEEIKDKLFGEEGLLGKDFDKKLKKKMPNILVGAGAGLLLGPGGFATKLILGSALGFASSTDKFKDIIFGKKDNEGHRQGGVIETLTRGIFKPITEFTKDLTKDLIDWTAEKVKKPIADAVDPVKKQLKLMFGSIGKFIHNRLDDFFENKLGAPFDRFMKEKVFGPINGFIKKALGLLLLPVKAPIRAVTGTIGWVGNRLRQRHVRHGDADYMTADQRLEFRKQRGKRRFLNIRPQADRFNKFDEALSNMGAKDAGDFASKIEAVMQSDREFDKYKDEAYSEYDKNIRQNKKLSVDQINAISKRLKDITALQEKGKLGKAFKIGRDPIRSIAPVHKLQQYITGLNGLDESEQDEIMNTVNNYIATLQEHKDRRKKYKGKKREFMDELINADVFKNAGVTNIKESDLPKLLKYLRAEEAAKTVNKHGEVKDPTRLKGGTLPSLNEEQQKRHEETKDILDKILKNLNSLLERDEDVFRNKKNKLDERAEYEYAWRGVKNTVKDDAKYVAGEIKDNIIYSDAADGARKVWDSAKGAWKYVNGDKDHYWRDVSKKGRYELATTGDQEGNEISNHWIDVWNRNPGAVREKYKSLTKDQRRHVLSQLRNGGSKGKKIANKLVRWLAMSEKRDGRGEIENAASGLKRVNKTGIVAVSEGEMIIPPDLNPYNIKKRKEEEDEAKRRFADSIPGFSEGTDIIDDDTIDTTSDTEDDTKKSSSKSKKDKKSGNIVASLLSGIKNTITGKNKSTDTDIDDKAPSILDNLKEKAANAKNRLNNVKYTFYNGMPIKLLIDKNNEAKPDTGDADTSETLREIDKEKEQKETMLQHITNMPSSIAEKISEVINGEDKKKNGVFDLLKTVLKGAGSIAGGILGKLGSLVGLVGGEDGGGLLSTITKGVGAVVGIPLLAGLFKDKIWPHIQENADPNIQAIGEKLTDFKEGAKDWMAGEGKFKGKGFPLLFQKGVEHWASGFEWIMSKVVPKMAEIIVTSLPAILNGVFKGIVAVCQEGFLNIKNWGKPKTDVTKRISEKFGSNSKFKIETIKSNKFSPLSEYTKKQTAWDKLTSGWSTSQSNYNFDMDTGNLSSDKDASNDSGIKSLDGTNVVEGNVGTVDAISTENVIKVKSILSQADSGGYTSSFDTDGSVSSSGNDSSSSNMTENLRSYIQDSGLTNEAAMQLLTSQGIGEKEAKEIVYGNSNGASVDKYAGMDQKTITEEINRKYIKRLMKGKAKDYKDTEAYKALPDYAKEKVSKALSEITASGENVFAYTDEKTGQVKYITLQEALAKDIPIDKTIDGKQAYTSDILKYTDIADEYGLYPYLTNEEYRENAREAGNTIEENAVTGTIKRSLIQNFLRGNESPSKILNHIANRNPKGPFKIAQRVIGKGAGVINKLGGMSGKLGQKILPSWMTDAAGDAVAETAEDTAANTARKATEEAAEGGVKYYRNRTVKTGLAEAASDKIDIDGLIKNAATKEESSLSKSLFGRIKSGLNGLFTNSKVFGRFKSLVKRFGKKYTDEQINNLAKKIESKLIGKCQNAVAKKAASMGAKGIAKAATQVLSAGVVTVGLAVYGFIKGWNNAESMLGIVEDNNIVDYDPNLLTKFIAAVTSAIDQICPIPGITEMAYNIVYNTMIEFGFESKELENIKEAREESTAFLEDNAIETGELLTAEEYNFQNSKLSKTKRKIKKGTKEFFEKNPVGKKIADVGEKTGLTKVAKSGLDFAFGDRFRSNMNDYFDGKKKLTDIIMDSANQKFTGGLFDSQDLIREKLGISEDEDVRIRDRLMYAGSNIAKNIPGVGMIMSLNENGALDNVKKLPGELWGGVKKVGKGIQSGIKTAGKGIRSGFNTITGNAFNDDAIRKKFGMGDDYEVTLQDRVSSFLGETTGRLFGEDWTANIDGGLTEIREGAISAVDRLNKYVGAQMGLQDENGKPLSLSEGLAIRAESVQESVSKHWKSFTTGVSDFWGDLGHKTEDFINGIAENTDKVLTKTNNVLGSVFHMRDANGNPLSFTEGAGQKINAVADFFAKKTDEFIDSAKDLWDNLSSKAGTLWGNIKSGIPKAMDKFNGMLGSLFCMEDGDGNSLSFTDGIANHASNNSGISKISNAWSSLRDGVSNIWKDVQSRFKELGNKSLEEHKSTSSSSSSSTTTASARGSGLLDFVGRGSGVNDNKVKSDNRHGGELTTKGSFVSQVDSRYAKRTFNTSGDTERQTIADTGCGPAAAAMVINNQYGQDKIDMNKASKDALKYKVKDGGVSAAYFENEFSKNKMSTEYIVDEDPETRASKLVDRVRNGGGVVIMGNDPGNTSKKDSPFGPNDHYVVANKISDDGKYIWVNDPESKVPNVKYSASKVLSNTKMGVSGIAASGSGMNKKPKVSNRKVRNYVKRSSAGIYSKKNKLFLKNLRDQDAYNAIPSGKGTKSIRNKLKYRNMVKKFSGRAALPGSSTREQVWNFLRSNGYSEAAAAGAIGNLQWESGGGANDIKLNATESTGEGVGMVQWSFGRKTNFINFCNSKGAGWPNSDVGIQCEFMLQELNGGEWMFAGGFGYDAKYNISHSQFKTCNDVGLATGAWCANYERCRMGDAHLDTRIQWAQQAYTEFSGKPVSGVSGSTSTSTGDSSSGGTTTTEKKSVFGTILDLLKVFTDMSDAYGLTKSGEDGDSSSSGGSVSGGQYPGNVVDDPELAAKQQALVAKMKSVEGQLRYSQGSDRYDPSTSGAGDCSSTVAWAYRNVLGGDGCNIDGNTDSQETDSDLYTPTTSLDESQMALGDLIMYGGHVEMYAGPGIMIGHGGGASGTEKGPTTKNIYDSGFRMIRRWVGFKDKPLVMSTGGGDGSTTSSDGSIVSSSTDTGSSVSTTSSGTSSSGSSSGGVKKSTSMFTGSDLAMLSTAEKNAIASTCNASEANRVIKQAAKNRRQGKSYLLPNKVLKSMGQKVTQKNGRTIIRTIGKGSNLINSFSGRGSGIDGKVKSSGRDDNFVSQLDSRYAKKSFNTKEDTEQQTIADSGCGPAAATMMINKAMGKKATSLEKTSKNALKYKVKNGGVSADYFEDEFAKNKMATDYMVESNKLDRVAHITESLTSGRDVVLMGNNPNNASKKNSPFGPEDHYVVANKISDDGKYIWVNDPESKVPNVKYSATEVLANTQMGLSGYAAGGSGITNVLKKRAKERKDSKVMQMIRKYSGRAAYPENSIQHKFWVKFRAAGYSEAATAAAMGNVQHESGFNPGASEYGGPGFGLIQWSTESNKAALFAAAQAKGVDPSDADFQVEYTLKYISDMSLWNNPSSSRYDGNSYSYNDFKNANGPGDIDKAVMAWMTLIERPSYDASVNHMDKRKASAKEFYQAFTGTAVSGADSSSSSGSSSSGNNITDSLEAFSSLAAAYGLKAPEDGGGLDNSDGSSSSGGALSSGGTEQQLALVNKMKSIEGKLRYCQGNAEWPGPRDAAGGVGSDCSETVQWAYKSVLGVDPGTNTYAQEEDSDLYTVTTSFDESKMQPGDLILYNGHVEMYAGPGKMIGHGGPGNGPTTKPLSDQGRFEMLRRWVGFKNISSSDIVSSGDNDSSSSSSSDSSISYVSGSKSGKKGKKNKKSEDNKDYVTANDYTMGYVGTKAPKSEKKNKKNKKKNGKGSGIETLLSGFTGRGSGLNPGDTIKINDRYRAPIQMADDDGYLPTTEYSKSSIKDLKIPTDMYAAGSKIKKKKNKGSAKVPGTAKSNNKIRSKSGIQITNDINTGTSDSQVLESKKVNNDKVDLRAYLVKIVSLLSKEVQNTAMLSTIITILKEIMKLSEQEKSVRNSDIPDSDKSHQIKSIENQKSAMMNILNATSSSTSNDVSNELSTLVSAAERLAKI